MCQEDEVASEHCMLMYGLAEPENDCTPDNMTSPPRAEQNECQSSPKTPHMPMSPTKLAAMKKYYLYGIQANKPEYRAWLNIATHRHYDMWLNGSPEIVNGKKVPIEPPEDIRDWIYESPTEYVKDYKKKWGKGRRLWRKR